MTENSWDQSPLPLWLERFEKVKLNPEDSFYEVFKLMEGIYAIFEPYNIQMVISYLIVGENRAMLFDTGMGVSPIDRVIKQLTDKPVFVVLSHSHFDHVGGAHLFDEVWGMDVPAARRNQAGEANKYLQIYAPPESFLKERIPADFDPEKYKIKKYKLTNFLLNGMRFDLGNRVLETYFAPGHSPDSIVMVDRLNRLLWTGDVFYVGQLFAYLGETNMKDYTKHSRDPWRIRRPGGLSTARSRHNTGTFQLAVKNVCCVHFIIRWRRNPISRFPRISQILFRRFLYHG